jgi:hypothetical protein
MLCFLCGTNWTCKYFVDESNWSVSLLVPTENCPAPLIWHSPVPKLASKYTFKGRTSGQCPGVFHIRDIFFSMALGLTQPLTEISTRNISWGVKAAGAYGWQPYHFHVPIVLKSGSLNLLEPSGLVQACNGIALPLRSVGWYFRIELLTGRISLVIAIGSYWSQNSSNWHLHKSVFYRRCLSLSLLLT